MSQYPLPSTVAIKAVYKQVHLFFFFLGELLGALQNTHDNTNQFLRDKYNYFHGCSYNTFYEASKLQERSQ